MEYRELFLVLVSVTFSHGDLVLSNNGYEGLQIVVADKIEEDASLISKIQEHFTDASAYLFQATNNRTFFREIDIIVPKSWATIPHNSTTASVDTSSEYFLVDEPHSTFNHSPYTRGNLECGKPSWYTHLTPGFLKSVDNAYGQPGRVIVHEWGHLRWGLFDEYPSIINKQVKNKRVYKHFYQKNGQNQGVRCSKHVQGVATKDNIIDPIACNLNLKSIDPECKFIPFVNQTARASIMSHQWIPTITGFCERHNENDASVPDDLSHNSDAENLQNRLCDGQSSWEVLHQHTDFKDGNNLPITSITDTSPVFHVVRKSGKVRVLVMDVSGSMGGTSSLGTTKIQEQAKAAEFVIDNVIEVGTFLSLVQFNSYGSILVGLTEIVNEESKTNLTNSIPRNDGGGTQIYNGLSKAMEVILSNGELSSDGAEIILLSDGMSNGPYLHILPNIQNKNVKVHTISITNSADPGMVTLAKETGGKSFSYLQTTQISFADVLAQSLKSNDAGETPSQQVFSNIFQVSSGNSQVSGSFMIDDGLGNDTSVAVLLPSSQVVNLEVVGPDGTVYNVTGSGDTVTLPVSSDGQIPTGEYNFTIDLPSGFTGTAEVHASSSPVSVDAEVIQVSGRLSETTISYGGEPVIVYVSVEKGKAPIMGVNVTLVLAADSSFTPVVLTLLDNGAGADPIAEDGVYSVYLMYTYFTVNSNYNIKLYVSSDGTAYYYTNGETSSRAASVSGTDDGGTTIQTVDAFDRIMVMEEITVNNFQTIVTDTIAPSKITDLAYQNVTLDTQSTPNIMTYEFVWTAPGSDLDVGQATSYEMRYGTSRDSLRNNFTTQQEVPVVLPQPQMSGVAESLDISFTADDCNGTCYVAIIATDENNLSGTVSNIVIIDVDFTYVIEPLTTVTTDGTTSTLMQSTLPNIISTSSTSTSNNSLTNIINVHIDEERSDTSKFVTIALPILITIVLILVAVVVFMVYKYYNRKDAVVEIKKEQFDEEDPEPDPPPMSLRDRHPWGHKRMTGRQIADIYPYFPYYGNEPWEMPDDTSHRDVVVHELDV